VQRSRNLVAMSQYHRAVACGSGLCKSDSRHSASHTLPRGGTDFIATREPIVQNPQYLANCTITKTTKPKNN